VRARLNQMTQLQNIQTHVRRLLSRDSKAAKEKSDTAWLLSYVGMKPKKPRSIPSIQGSLHQAELPYKMDLRST
jgi:hypothetical protein